MKLLLTLLIISNSTYLYSQPEYKFIFFDACSKKFMELDYQLWHPLSDTTIRVKAGQNVNLKEDTYYQLSTQLHSEHNDWIATFYFDIYSTLNRAIDTFYLHQLKSLWNGLLHPQKVEFYFCNMRCDGTIEELDSNGIIRGKGKFKKGIPASNIKFFDSSGKLERKLFYKNGNLKMIK